MEATCIFCQIAAGKAEAAIVYEDKKLIAFLDKRPVFPGHCLVMPKEHVPTFYDLPEILLKPLFRLTQRIGKAVEKGLEAEGSFIANNNTVSQSVPHIHIHVIPRNFKDGLRGFFWPRNSYSDEEHIRAIQAAIKRSISD